MCQHRDKALDTHSAFGSVPAGRAQHGEPHEIVMSASRREPAAPLSALCLLRPGANLLTSRALSFKSRGVMTSRSIVRSDIMENKTISMKSGVKIRGHK